MKLPCLLAADIQIHIYALLYTLLAMQCSFRGSVTVDTFTFTRYYYLTDLHMVLHVLLDIEWLQTASSSLLFALR